MKTETKWCTNCGTTKDFPEIAPRCAVSWTCSGCGTLNQFERKIQAREPRRKIAGPPKLPPEPR